MGIPDEFVHHREASVRAANEALATMRDKLAEWWHYSVSHLTLDLVIHEPGKEGNIAISLAGCDNIAGPTRWPQQKLEVLWHSNTGFIVQDETVGFKASGKYFVWKMNLDLAKHRSVHLGPSLGV